MRLSKLLWLLVPLVSTCCSGSQASISGPSDSVSSVTVTGVTALTRAGQTLQLTATAKLASGSTQDVTGMAAWQSSNAAIAAVSSSGVVTAAASGAVTITATYQGVAATATIAVTITPATPSSRSSMSAIVDGVPWNAVTVLALKTPLPTDPTGVLGVTGTNAFSGAFIEIAFGVPAAVGSYSFGPGLISNAALQIPANRAQWLAGTSGGTGTITVTTVTAAGATGTFSLNLVAERGTTATGTKVVTNGVFSVTF